MSSDRDGERSLEYYEERMQALDNQMLESSRRSRQQLEEAAQIGAETMVELDEQGEKLDRAESTLDNIDQDLRTSQRTIRQIRSVFGGVVNWFTTDKLATTPSTATSSEQARQGKTGSSAAAADRYTQPASSAPRGGQQQQRQQAKKYRNAQEQELDSNLECMSSTLGALKNMGQDMGDVLQAQNDQIERMTPRVTTLTNKVDDLKQQTRRLT